MTWVIAHRGASWDAIVEKDPENSASPVEGALLYVISTNGNTLNVTIRRPA